MTQIIHMAHPDELKKYKSNKDNLNMVIKLLVRLRADKSNQQLWGCTNEHNQPINTRTRHKIFTFINEPNEKNWHRIYNTQVNNRKTLWHLWVQLDKTAPLSFSNNKWDTLPTSQQLQDIVHLRRNLYQSSCQVLVEALGKRIKTFKDKHPQHASLK